MMISELIRLSNYQFNELAHTLVGVSDYKKLVKRMCELQKEFDEKKKKLSIYEIEQELFSLLDQGYKNLTPEQKERADNLQRIYVSYGTPDFDKTELSNNTNKATKGKSTKPFKV